MVKYNKLTVISVILTILGYFIFCLVAQSSLIIQAINLLVPVVAFILSVIALKQINKNKQKGKWLAVVGIIIAILLFFSEFVVLYTTYALSNVEIADANACSEVTDCVDNGDGTSTCLYAQAYNATCTTDKLNEDQFK